MEESLNASGHRKHILHFLLRTEILVMLIIRTQPDEIRVKASGIFRPGSDARNPQIHLLHHAEE